MYEELVAFVDSHAEVEPDGYVLEQDCAIIEYLLDHCEISIPENNRFFVSINCPEMIHRAVDKRVVKYDHLLEENGLLPGLRTLAYTGVYDFSHTTPDWESVMELGLPGLKKRVETYGQKSSLENQGNNPENNAERNPVFYREIIRVYDAALRFVSRAADVAADAGKDEMAQGLRNLCENAPANLYEALQLSIVYYVLQHLFEGTYLRTMGRLDGLLFPFYIREEKEVARAMLLDYMQEIDRLEAPSNIPFALGGTDMEGNCLINELSYVLMDIYHEAQTSNTKLHLLCDRNIPADIVEKAAGYIQAGSNSIVFMSDEMSIQSLEYIGAEHQDAVNYHVVGCYECGAWGELASTCNGRVNIPKALEAALNGGRCMLTGELIGLESEGKFETYDELKAEFDRQLAYFCKCAMAATDCYEANYRQIHSAPFLSSTYEHCLAAGGDLYADYSAKYNSSSVNGLGLATATDALAAIRKAVYEDKMLSLEEMKKILTSDWEGKEPLRLLIKNRFPKFGQGDAKTDAIAKEIVDVLDENITGKHNTKGGKYRLGLFSINWRWGFGAKTAASADGRKAGETISQNTSATFGADKEGATAHLLSVASIDATRTPNGAIADIDLHASAVQGASGVKMLAAMVKTFFEQGGLSVHMNVLNTEVLKAAKEAPEKYPSLQVRLCGWNVLFSTLSEKEKDEFIARSMQ